MSNLLKDASILLTPTAYDNGRMLAVKPEIALGEELVVNGDFATDSDWTKGTGWSISGGTSNCDGTQTSSSNLTQNINITTVNKKFKIKFSVTNFQSGILKLYVGGINFFESSGNGDFEGYIDVTSLSSDTNVYLNANSSFIGSIDNVSVKEDLSGDFQFSRNSAATRVNAQGLVENVQILSSNLVSNGDFSQEGAEEVSNGSFSQEGAEQVTAFTNGTTYPFSTFTSLDNNITSAIINSNFAGCVSNSISVTSSQTYKVSFNYTKNSGDDLRVVFSSSVSGAGSQTSNSELVSTSGSITLYLTISSSGTSYLQLGTSSGSASIDFSITNISVKEVGQDWTVGASWTIDNGFATSNGGQSFLTQNVGFVVGLTYLVTFNINRNSGNLFVRDSSGVTKLIINENNDTTLQSFYFTSTSSGIINFYSYDYDGSISNISVKEVGQDWTLGTGWSIGENKAICDGSDGVNITQNGVIENIKKYKISFNVLNYVSGFLNGRIGSANSNDFTVSSDGNYSFNITSDGTNFIFRSSSFNGSITNISVIEITDDTNLPRINYEGFSYQDSLGSEEIVNGDFATDSDWNKGANTTISEGTLNSTSAGVYIIANQTNVATQNKYYKWEATYTITSGEVRLGFSSGVFTGSSQTSSGTYTGVFQAPSGINGQIYITSPSSDFVGSIDNISVKEYLGQEVVPNSGCGSWLLEPQRTNLITYSEDFSQSAWTKSNSSVVSGFTSLSGDASAFELNIQSSNGYLLEQISYSAVTGQSVTASIFAKNEITDFLRFGGATVAGTDVYSIEDYGNGWFRHTITRTFTTTFVGSIQFIIYAQVGNNVIWGAQLEQNSFATSYIPTQGAISTRLQDIANNSGNASLINSEEGVLYAEISAFEETNSFESISINNNSTSDRIFMGYYTDDLYITVVNGGQAKYDVSTPINVKQNNKIAVKYKAQDFCFYLNGFKINASVGINGGTTPIGLSKLSFDRGDGVEPFYGKTKALAVYKTALTDASLRSLTYPPAVATTFDLNFNTIADDFTFTRGSEATFVNAQGLIQSTASNDAPRLDYSTGAEAFLLEPQSTNLITYSSDFSDASWSKYGTPTIDITSIISPDGTLNGTKVTRGSNATPLRRPNLTTLGTEYTFSLYAKKGSVDKIYLDIGDVADVEFTLTDEWQRFEITQTPTNFTHIDISFGTSVSGDHFFIYGAQLEQLSYPTSYIPTSGASATRNQELCNNATPVINSEEGTLYAEMATLADTDSIYRAISVSDGTTSNRAIIRYNLGASDITFLYVKDGVTSANIYHIGSEKASDFNKFAFSWKLNEFKVYLNGTQVGVTDTVGNVSNAFTKLSFNDGVANPFYGNTKGLKVYPKALADVQLQDLTTL